MSCSATDDVGLCRPSRTVPGGPYSSVPRQPAEVVVAENAVGGTRVLVARTRRRRTVPDRRAQSRAPVRASSRRSPAGRCTVRRPRGAPRPTIAGSYGSKAGGCVRTALTWVSSLWANASDAGDRLGQPGLGRPAPLPALGSICAMRGEVHADRDSGTADPWSAANSSVAGLPVRSPHPLSVVSMIVAPASTAATALASARPKSL